MPAGLSPQHLLILTHWGDHGEREAHGLQVLGGTGGHRSTSRGVEVLTQNGTSY